MIAVQLVGYDEGCQTLGLYDTRGNDGWRFSLAELPLARDLQLLPEGRILVGFDRGYFEMDAGRGTVTKVVDRWTGVTSVRRVDGLTLVAGVDLTDRPGITVITLDSQDRVLETAVRPGDYVRLFRPTPEGTWLLGSDDHFLETSTDLTELRRLSAPGFRHAWMAHRDQSTLVSAGYGAFMAWFDASGRLDRVFGGASEVPAEVQPFFYAMFEPLKDGSLLVANWQGHGPDNGAKGRQLLHFAPGGGYLDSCSFPGVSSLQGILVLN
jgi:hypothetical protein